MKISEIFKSIEGEGIAIGKLEVFVRLAGCNLNCSWCDTKYALENGKKKPIEEIIKEVQKYCLKNVSITGGEPLLQKSELLELVTNLKTLDYWIQLNTNGTIFDQQIFKKSDLISMDCKCPSSQMKSDIEVLKKTIQLFDYKSQIKFVISNNQDYKFAKNIISSIKASTVVFQPEWKSRLLTEELVNKVKNDCLNVRVILQQHKTIWGERKGV